MNIVHLVGNGFDIKAGLRTDAKTLIAEIVKSNKDKDIPDYARNLLDTISSEGIETWADFESKLGEYSNNEIINNDPNQYVEAKAFFDENLAVLIQERMKQIDNSFIDKNSLVCMNNLSNIFNALSDGNRRQLFTLLSNPSSNTVISHNFVVFNYTPTLLKMINKSLARGQRLDDKRSRFMHYLGKHQYAHGFLGGVPVCGIDNVEQVTNKQFRDNPNVINTLIKESIQHAIGSEDHINAKQIIDEADIVSVFGMSFGKTDLRWWKYIIDRLKNKQIKAVILFVYNSDLPSSVPWRRIKAMENAKNKFFEAADCHTEDVRIKIEGRVFIAYSEDLFYVPEPIELES